MWDLRRNSIITEKFNLNLWVLKCDEHDQSWIPDIASYVFAVEH